jgi:hypothetical protein
VSRGRKLIEYLDENDGPIDQLLRGIRRQPFGYHHGRSRRAASSSSRRITQQHIRMHTFPLTFAAALYRRGRHVQRHTNEITWEADGWLWLHHDDTLLMYAMVTAGLAVLLFSLPLSPTCI